jgi:hypothetical protein
MDFNSEDKRQRALVSMMQNFAGYEKRGGCTITSDGEHQIELRRDCLWCRQCGLAWTDIRLAFIEYAWYLYNNGGQDPIDGFAEWSATERGKELLSAMAAATNGT